jgi:hypothetical protein
MSSPIRRTTPRSTWAPGSSSTARSRCNPRRRSRSASTGRSPASSSRSRSTSAHRSRSTTLVLRRHVSCRSSADDTVVAWNP